MATDATAPWPRTPGASGGHVARVRVPARSLRSELRAIRSCGGAS